MKAIGKKHRIATAVIALVFSYASHAQEPQAAPQAPDLQEKANSIQAEIADIRGLPFKRSVKAELQSSEDFGTYIDRGLRTQLPDEIKKYYGEIVRKLGLYSGPLIENGGSMMKMIMTSQAAAYYDPDKQTFFVLMPNMPELMLGAFYAHELYHGLQDQYFDLNRYLLNTARQGSLDADEIMARQCIVEGEATYMMLLWLIKHSTGQIPQRDVLAGAIDMQTNMNMETLRASLKQPQVAAIMGEDMKTAMGTVDKIPPFLFDALIGAYFKGLAFVFAVEEKGWKEVEKLYTVAPPASMSQVLHPEKWLARQAPMRIKLPALNDPALRDWELIDANVLGEFRLRSVFKAQGLAADATTSTTGWDGDRYAVLKRKDSDEMLLLFYTTWESEADANKFAGAYRRVLANKYSGAVEPTRVLQKSKDVLIVEGGSEANLDAMIALLGKSKLARAQ